MQSSTFSPIIIIGGGAAGFFSALSCKKAAPKKTVFILEKTQHVLSKVRISGGGRCNVTHACFDIPQLVHNYPRGYKALYGTFSRFQPKDIIQWFEERGVPLKTEADGRIFPQSNSSESITSCLLAEAKHLGVEIRTGWDVEAIQKNDASLIIQARNKPSLHAAQILVASGSNKSMWESLSQLGHTVIPPVPSLFTFNVPSSPLLDLAGISIEKAHVQLEGTDFLQTGPLLLTHWGFSGPAILKLSSWAARYLHSLNYKTTCIIDWHPSVSHHELTHIAEEKRQHLGYKTIASEALCPLPKGLYKRFLELCSINSNKKWAHVSHQEIHLLINWIKQARFLIDGKTTYKQEFVTCGGIDLREIEFKTMQSKLIPHLYFAGEVLNIDGITGGFNFQNAWSTGWIAGNAMAQAMTSLKD